MRMGVHPAVCLTERTKPGLALAIAARDRETSLEIEKGLPAARAFEGQDVRHDHVGVVSCASGDASLFARLLKALLVLLNESSFGGLARQDAVQGKALVGEHSRQVLVCIRRRAALVRTRQAVFAACKWR